MKINTEIESEVFNYFESVDFFAPLPNFGLAMAFELTLLPSPQMKPYPFSDITLLENFVKSLYHKTLPGSAWHTVLATFL